MHIYRYIYKSLNNITKPLQGFHINLLFVPKNGPTTGEKVI